MPEERRKLVLRIGGMDCPACAARIERKIGTLVGIFFVTVCYQDEKAEIEYDPHLLAPADILRTIHALGYTPEDADDVQAQTVHSSTLPRTLGFLAVILVLWLLLDKLGVLNYLVPSQLADTGMGYGMLFLVGLLTSVHCIAMCGGINLSQALPKQEAREEEQTKKLQSVTKKIQVFSAVFYNLGRVLSYTVIGGVLGAIGSLGGSAAGLPTLVQGILKLLAGVLMIIMGLNTLNLFPALRKLQPRFRLPGGGKAKTGRQPFVVGLLNGLMPCGPLQSMQILALASGSALRGALAMLCFSLGTVPLMLGLGSLVAALGKKFAKHIMAVGGVLVVVLGLAMLSQGWHLSGFRLPQFESNRSYSSESSRSGSPAAADTAVQNPDGTQTVKSTLLPNRYPNITVQAGKPVIWEIEAPESSINGCNGRMLSRDLGFTHSFTPGTNTITFTPAAPGTYRYTCWMGMIAATVTVT
ncbi:MAG: sulfite exporter TauE/SafE family protein [Oscillospiraceae bacterium]|jgi:sulfite exporter TauE/SafE/copper chaperone CopZ|nr:sulfite exporter TauE/SafE family protein [Oscillospiraceae bacterium]